VSELAYEVPRSVNQLASVVLAANPSSMTLEGTNTWLLRAPDSDSAVVVDPGPDHDAHLRPVIEAAGRVSRILLTHGHVDHSAGARRLAELTGAPVQALDARQRLGTEGLRDGEVIEDSGVEVRVWTTPGHSSDSLSFVLDDGTTRAVLTGDTILGRGTTVVAHPDGNLAAYLTSLRRLAELGAATVLPGHGPELAQAGVAAQQYLDHREQRLAQVREALAALGPDADARAVVERVYSDVDQRLWWAAEMSVKAQLDYLRAG
jgi:glyoxylase-like metal-dependent hydrolase (beta-lactamase superfamily II)